MVPIGTRPPRRPCRSMAIATSTGSSRRVTGATSGGSRWMKKNAGGTASTGKRFGMIVNAVTIGAAASRAGRVAERVAAAGAATSSVATTAKAPARRMDVAVVMSPPRPVWLVPSTVPGAGKQAPPRAVNALVRVRRGSATVVVLQLLVPAGAAALGNEVEEVPQRLQVVDVAGLLARLGRRVEQLRAPEVADLVAVACKDVEHRLLRAVLGLAGVRPLVAGVPRREQGEPPPAPLARERRQALDRRLGHDHEPHPLREVVYRPVELVEQRGTGRARALGQREQRGLPRPGARPVVVRVTREHEVVDRERVLARREELGQAHPPLDALERVVLRHHTPGGKRAPRRRHRLGGAAQFDLLLEQAVARGPVVRRLAGEPHAHCCALMTLSKTSLPFSTRLPP